MSMPLEAFIHSLNKDQPAGFQAQRYLCLPDSRVADMTEHKQIIARTDWVIMTFELRTCFLARDQISMFRLNACRNIWRISATYGFHETPDRDEVFGAVSERG